MTQRKKDIWLICPGLGHINRGYETFSRQCFDTLRHSDKFEVYLYKGAGQNEPHEKALWCLKRNGTAAKWLAKLCKREPYFIEQFSFLLSILPALVFKKPAIIFYSDFHLGTWLWHWRKITGLRYKLLFCNGAPNGPPFTRSDHVQQLVPHHYQTAIQGGTPASMQTILPLGINMPNLQKNEAAHQSLLAKIAGRKIILSIGAVNASHKRMDYVLQEFAKLDAAAFFLVIIGQLDAESAAILQLAQKLLPAHNYSITTETLQSTMEIIALSDCFVLASLHEGFGIVLLEAAAVGLPVMVHDYEVSRQVLGSYGHYLNLSQPGSLSQAILQLFQHGYSVAEKQAQIAFIQNTYSWQALRPGYEALLEKLLE